MDYTVFENCDANRLEGESDREHMERIVRSSHVPHATGLVCMNDLVEGTFYDCDPEKRSLTLEFLVKDWMTNPAGGMHGGIMATVLDITLGQLVRYCTKQAACVTVSLSVDYLRGAVAGDTVLVEACADKVGRRLTFLHASIASKESGKLLATAKATFM